MDGAGPNTHRIRRLSFELGSADEDAMLALRQQVAAMADTLETTLAAVLDAHVDAMEVVTLDRLEIPLDPAELHPGAALDPATLATALDRALTRALARRSPSAAMGSPAHVAVTGPAVGRTPVDHLAATLAVFLRTGTLPWWAPAERLGKIERAVAALSDADIATIARHLAPLLMHPRAATRLAIQLAPEQARRIAAALPRARDLPPLPLWREATRAPAGAADHRSPRDSLVAQIRRAAGADPDAAPVPQDVRTDPRQDTRAMDPAPVDAATPQTEDSRDDDDAPAGPIAIPHAGVILTAPFLPTFFDRLDLLHARAFRDTAAAERAVALIGAIAGDPEPAEPDLALAKLLAGRPLASVQPREVDLTDGERNAVEELLTAMIGHWTALGKTSPEGLRETFLCRPGRLDCGSAQDRLELERSGVDILIDRLPWTLTPVRLPWMARPLHVGWR